MSNANYSKFLEFLTRLSRGEIAEIVIVNVHNPYQFRWRDGYIEWRQRPRDTYSEWVTDTADVNHHLHIASDYPITWLGQPPQPERSNIRRVEL